MPAVNPPPAAVARPPTLHSVQAGRGLAALLVVLGHTSASVFDIPKYWATNPVGPLFDFGHAGVEFFFVLSGFIILFVHWADIGRGARSANFLRKRFLRIYPIYWLVLAALLVVYFAVPSFGEGFERDPDIILSSALLILGDRVSDTFKPITIIPAAWTLYHEVLFYAFFMILILSRRIGAGLFLAWLVLSSLPLFGADITGVAAFYLAPYHLLFAMGMAAAWLYRRQRVPLPAVLAVLGPLLFFGAGMEEVWIGWLPIDLRSLVYGLGSMLSLLAYADLERRGRLRVPAALVLLGEASYALYLVHLPVLVLLAKLSTRLPGRDAIPLGVSYAVFVVTTVLIGVMFHLVVERPLLRRLNRRRSPPAASSLLIKASP
ncbi:MAG TPA: acyltransferase [Stellaceae bacterium]|nr:acyltransferase [Stellaceae bacterium]